MEVEFEKEVVERLIRIETQINNGITGKICDHEKRVRFLERGLYIAIGGLGLLQILLSYFIK